MIEQDGSEPKRGHGRLSSLISGFAHEIKNPLSTIGLNLSLMEEELEGSDGPRERRLLKRTQRLSKEVDRIQGILQSFLNYVRGPDPQLQAVSVNTVVRELVDLLAPGLESQGIRINVYLEEGLPEIQADASLLHQALLNLVKNAEQALGEASASGEILIRTGREGEDEAAVVLLSVMDSGPGMSEEAIASCMRPYFSTKAGGTGLGLPITQRYIEQHGGELLLESQLGTGTRFTIRLPVLGPSRPLTDSSGDRSGEAADGQTMGQDDPSTGGDS